MVEILTALLVIITGCYAWITFRMLKSNEKAVSVMRQQLEMSTRPYVDVHPFMVASSPDIFLQIRNRGNSAAYNLKLELDRAFHEGGAREDKARLNNFYAFQNTIECFTPGMEIYFRLGAHWDIFGEISDQNLTPNTFKVKASYSYTGNSVEEVTTIDLRHFFMSTTKPEAFIYELRELNKSVQKTAKSLESLTSQVRSLAELMEQRSWRMTRAAKLAAKARGRRALRWKG